MIGFWILGIIILIFKLKYIQVGPTCGFYALVYGVSKVKRGIKKKREVRRLIITSIENGISNVGEIFDINVLYKIAKENFSELKIELVEVRTVEELDKYLNRNYVILPCLQKHIPHYYLLKSKSSTGYKYWSLCPFKKKREFYDEHKKLKNIIFDWSKDYFDVHNKNLYWRVNYKCENLINCIIDTRLGAYLASNEKKKKASLYSKKVTVNMYGRAIIIEKRK